MAQVSERQKGKDDQVLIELLHLIELGEATKILSAEFSGSLNELLKRELVTIEDEKLQLTAKGMEAKMLGINHIEDKASITEKTVPISDFKEDTLEPPMNRMLMGILLFFLISIGVVCVWMSLNV